MPTCCHSLSQHHAHRPCGHLCLRWFRQCVWHVPHGCVAHAHTPRHRVSVSAGSPRLNVLRSELVGANLRCPRRSAAPLARNAAAKSAVTVFHVGKSGQSAPGTKCTVLVCSLSPLCMCTRAAHAAHLAPCTSCRCTSAASSRTCSALDRAAIAPACSLQAASPHTGFSKVVCCIFLPYERRRPQSRPLGLPSSMPLPPLGQGRGCPLPFAPPRRP